MTEIVEKVNVSQKDQSPQRKHANRAYFHYAIWTFLKNNLSCAPEQNSNNPYNEEYQSYACAQHESLKLCYCLFHSNVFWIERYLYLLHFEQDVVEHQEGQGK